MNFIIETPMFQCTYNGTTTMVNEYTVRNIMYHISKGNIKPEDVVLTDCEGTIADIKPNGLMRNTLKGMDINTDLSFATLSRGQIQKIIYRLKATKVESLPKFLEQLVVNAHGNVQ